MKKGRKGAYPPRSDILLLVSSLKGKGAYPITRGGRVTGFRQRGGAGPKKAAKPVKRRIKRRVVSHALKLPKAPATIEAVFPSEGVGFFDAWDAEEFYSWADEAKKALEKTVPLEEVESLWRSIPSYEMAVVDGDRSTVIPYSDGETFIDDVENALKTNVR